LLQLAFILIAAAMPWTIEAAVSAAPAPYTATYAVKYRGLDAGLLHFELLAEEPGKFVYESYAEPNLLARLIVGHAAERSLMRIDEDGVRPLSWFTMKNGKSGALHFAWDEARVSGIVEEQRVDLPAEEGLQDRMSLQIAVITALLRDREPGTMAMIDDGKVKRYRYTRVGPERIKTKAGEFDAVLYESTRPGSSRVSRVWHAPALGFIPVRAEQARNGKVETVTELIRVQKSR
jgi:hypothetical protein